MSEELNESETKQERKRWRTTLPRGNRTTKEPQDLI